MKYLQTTAILLHTFLLVLGTTATALAAEKAPTQKIIPLDWEWKSSEIKDMKKLLKDVTSNSDGTYEYEGETWKVKTYHTARFTIQVSQYMEMFSDVFYKAFKFQQESEFSAIKPTMIVYASQNAYNAAVPPSVKDSGGVFMPRWQTQGGKLVGETTLTLATFYESNDKEPSFDKKAPLDTIQHEGTHCLLQQIFGAKRVPAWLTEGAATYYESWDLRKKLSDNDESSTNVKVRNDRRTHSWRPRTMRYLTEKKGGELPRLEYLTSLGITQDWIAGDMKNDQTHYHYCLVESFTDYLMNSKNRRPFLYAMMKRLHDGEAQIITPAEQLEHEKGWLMFLEEKWGVKFDKFKIEQRVAELKKRVDDSAGGSSGSAEKTTGSSSGGNKK